MNLAIQNTCPATWVNSSIVPNQSTFQAYPIPAPVESVPIPIPFSVGAAAVRGAVAGTLALLTVRIVSLVVLLVFRNATRVAWGAAGVVARPPRVSG
jgi:hypothetical protein